MRRALERNLRAEFAARLAALESKLSPPPVGPVAVRTTYQQPEDPDAQPAGGGRVTEEPIGVDSWETIAAWKHRALDSEKAHAETRRELEMAHAATLTWAEQLQEMRDELGNARGAGKDSWTEYAAERRELLQRLADVKHERDSEQRWAAQYKAERDAAVRERDEARRLRMTKVVWADEASPFDGPQVKALLDENERLRARLAQTEKVVEAAREQADAFETADDDRYERAKDATRAAVRALDALTKETT